MYNVAYSRWLLKDAALRSPLIPVLHTVGFPLPLLSQTRRLILSYVHHAKAT